MYRQAHQIAAGSQIGPCVDRGDPVLLLAWQSPIVSPLKPAPWVCNNRSPSWGGYLRTSLPAANEIIAPHSLPRGSSDSEQGDHLGSRVAVETGDPRSITFGCFRVEPTNQRLFEDDCELPIGSRALEILVKLLERPGELVTKDELVAHVWPDTYVEEGNLRTQMSLLRRMLKDGEGHRRFIVTIPGRGYRFVGPVARAGAEAPARAAISGELPSRLTDLFGRDETILTIKARLSQSRLVTVVGPGGVGKTSVAVAVARQLYDAYPDGIAFVDLGMLGDQSLVSRTVAAALGVVSASQQPTASIANFLRHKRMLLILDNCEQLIDTVASVVIDLLNEVTGLSVLATSRERLRVQGEHAEYLSGLPFPKMGRPISINEAVSYPAVQLFAARASAIDASFAMSDTTASMVVDICAQLDGLPLALEMAAGRIDQFGISGIHERLDEQLQLLAKGCRNSLERHQTLRSTLDWSYSCLTFEQQAVFRRLAVFSGPFTLDAGAMVAASGGDNRRAVDTITELVSKSLVVADFTCRPAVYRFLNTTRAYALEKLSEAGEFDSSMARLVAYFSEGHAQLPSRRNGGSDTWIPFIPSVLAALDWAFSRAGDAASAVDLVVAAAPLLQSAELFHECRARTMQALTELRSQGRLESPAAMRLYEILAITSLGACGPHSAVDDAYEKVWAIATKLNDADFRLRALSGQCVSQFMRFRYDRALEIANEYRRLAENTGRGADVANAERIIANVMLMQGDVLGARTKYELLRSAGDNAPLRAREAGLLEIFYAYALCLEGQTRRALEVIRGMVGRARKNGDLPVLFLVLAHGACPIARRAEDLGLLKEYTALLSTVSAGHALFEVAARSYEAIVRMADGQDERGVAELQSELDRISPSDFCMNYFMVQTELADGYRRLGRTDEAQQILKYLIQSAERSGAEAHLPDLLRCKGEVLLAQGDRGAAEVTLKEALHLAQAQKAGGQALRIVSALTRLRPEEDLSVDVHQLLTDVAGPLKSSLLFNEVAGARNLVDFVPTA